MGEGASYALEGDWPDDMEISQWRDCQAQLLRLASPRSELGGTMTTRRDILAGALAAAALPALARADEGGQYVPVPFFITPGDKIGINVHINGSGPYLFAVDSGADVSCIQSDLAQKLGLKFTRGTVSGGLGGEEIEGVYLAKAVRFGPYLPQRDVAFDGLSHFKSRLSGLVAAGFLTTLPSVLDFGAREIRIYTKGTPDLSGFIPVDSRLDASSPAVSARIFVHVTIDGVPLKLLVDTGSPPYVLLFPSVVRAHGLWDKYGAGTPGKGEGTTGVVSSTRLVTMPDFALSDVTLPHVPVSLMDPAGHNENDGSDGLLGLRFLEMFTVAITSKGMALRPIAPPATAASSSAAS